VRSCVIYLTKKHKISAASQPVATARIAPKICQGQPQQCTLSQSPNQQLMKTRCSRGRPTSPRCRHLVKWTKHTSRFWFWPIPSVIWKHDVIHKPKLNNILHCCGRRNPTTVTGNMYWTFREIWTGGFEICEETHRQTNEQADIHTCGSQYFAAEIKFGNKLTERRCTWTARIRYDSLIAVLFQLLFFSFS